MNNSILFKNYKPNKNTNFISLMDNFPYFTSRSDKKSIARETQ